jgi:lipopolysaccharide transport system ATP-binding protein
MPTAITVENLSKKYIIGHKGRESYSTFRDVIASGAKSLGKNALAFVTGRKIHSHRSYKEVFWALKDVELDIQRGDRIGLIGRNGAGKSTLLKILSRITEPTAGKISTSGRVASLLEVGTGFHPELTGRENIFLNGAILGMSRAEIKSKFDEIVDFAGIEKFLDTPVKRYSSGMYIRLAFSVAAHLESEILIVDEVLAVGDSAFQKKCLGKMEEVGNQGRTVIFVSHNMGMISRLCSSCIWLDQGRIKEIGETEKVVNSYLLDGTAQLSGEKVFPDDVKKPAQLKRIRLLNQDNEVALKFNCDQAIKVQLDLRYRKRLPGLYGYIGISRPDGTMVLVSDSNDVVGGKSLDNLPDGDATIIVTIPPRSLGHGDYLVHFALASELADTFHVDVPGVVCGFSLDDFTSKRGNSRDGYFSMLLPWQIHDAKEWTDTGL